ncbi:hypothetical protein CXF51_07005 [Bacillus subtilis subsp. subtilis]|nr:hypothetical protein CXF51_07005 [Bacillus subtilis subsp. subtilis]
MKGTKGKVFRVFTAFLAFVLFITAYDLTKGSEKPEDIHNTSLLRNSCFFNWLESKKTRGSPWLRKKKQTNCLTEVR